VRWKNELQTGIGDKYWSHYLPGGKRYAGIIILLGCFEGADVDAFSFSSASLGVEVTLSLRLDNLVLDSKVALEARRSALETGGLVFAALPNAEGTLRGTGDEVRVPTAEVRKIVGGGTAFPTCFPAVDGAAFVRPELGAAAPRAPCFRFT
jgi:hypothetical protein